MPCDMALELASHCFASHRWKVLIALCAYPMAT
jgi:hypothetical protein